ncbi:TPA: tRNA (N6-threonylcarbamoyladenosine(37)-N6)-methyltransferase TrmO [Candidatus Bipolaricaulota bacterium]|nr:tRNA (N6-threonylcarbamoyladenosine(37)-N6)-methyltransferase TrmO [Candidatus Bipolaricaulota bacterium]
MEVEVKEVKLKPIGIIHTPHKRLEDVPIQPCMSGCIGEIEVDRQYQEGLKDIEGFSHIVILYLFHRSRGYSLSVKPFLDDKPRGLFATRHPRRPNPIGISTVKLLERERNVLKVLGIDVLDGTPLIDIKPHVPQFDHWDEEVRIGWLEGKLGSGQDEAARGDQR